nr:hypothetical protein [Janibacter melonis]
MAAPAGVPLLQDRVERPTAQDHGVGPPDLIGLVLAVPDAVHLEAEGSRSGDGKSRRSAVRVRCGRPPRLVLALSGVLAASEANPHPSHGVGLKVDDSLRDRVPAHPVLVACLGQQVGLPLLAGESVLGDGHQHVEGARCQLLLHALVLGPDHALLVGGDPVVAVRRHDLVARLVAQTLAVAELVLGLVDV